MTRQAKEDLERLYLDRVRDLLTDFPPGAIDEREQPDFLVKTADRVIGIEITELHRANDSQPVPMQGREAIRDQIVQRVSLIAVIRPLAIGIYRPLGPVPRGVSNDPVGASILRCFSRSSYRSFSTPAAPSDRGSCVRRAPGSRRCGAGGPAWPRRAAGSCRRPGPTR